MRENNSSDSKIHTFSGLDLPKPVSRALEQQQLEEMTPVQQQAIPQVRTGGDLMVAAATGSGKTLAFAVPIVQAMLEKPAPNTSTRALILAPTRELARQLHKQFDLLTQSSRVEVGAITGGAVFKYQKAMLRKNPEIVIATPGRILEHVQKGSADMGDLEFLVLDEADRMLDLGLGDEVLELAGACNPGRQTLLFSATLRRGAITELAGKLMQQPQMLEVDSAHTAHKAITQQYCTVDDDSHKARLLTWLLAHEPADKVVIFCNTRARVEALGEVLGHHNLDSVILHGDLTQDERNEVTHRFRLGRAKILLATDVAARGLDIKGVDLVVNYDMAQSPDDYVHRIGRTGRAGEEGLAVSLIARSDWRRKGAVEKFLDMGMEQRVIKGLQGKYRGERPPESRQAPSPWDKSAKKPAGKKPGAGRPHKKPAAGKRPGGKGQAGKGLGGRFGDGSAPLTIKPRKKD
ncbi:DEAD/DEAH box helicase [Biformimicrobium ophioploci]|uniref:DEAD/DEAH box helicase n=1 Tax=Biformimicrobium ophioploci TaxID=3036711 RepID=A0ABQ6LZW4_9GAMM|nr:DEAD/DEAH box helicase [Microbulbifer sp. NKW57]GMG87617.1 DEAD/DEAH box helicase [Microbulbifer sp. NKW57]